MIYTLFMGNNALVLILFLISIAIAGYAQYKVSSTFKKYSKVQNNRKISGFEAVELFKKRQGLNVEFKSTEGSLSDHYDQRSKVVALSKDVGYGTSIASIAVAAHEMGHACQDQEGSMLFKVRDTLLPITTIASTGAIPLVIFGFLFSYGPLILVGIILYSFIVLFHLATLPLEINASQRGVRMIKESGILGNDEIPGANRVLRAAAFTYVAALLVALVQLLRFILIYLGRR